MIDVPVSVHSSEMEDAFTASSRRLTRAFLIAQIHEAEIYGVGDCLWVTQMRVCVEKIDARLGDRGASHLQDHPALHLVKAP